MGGHSFGTIFKLTTHGESHGQAIGGIISGCPAGLEIDLEAVQNELDKRKPGQSSITTQRKESDIVTFTSGIFEGKTSGSPIGFTIPNKDQQSGDYDHLKDVYRPSHADFTYDKKYGHRDHRGGGRSSARETASWVVGGAIAKTLIALDGIKVHAYVSQVGSIKLETPYQQLDLSNTFLNSVRCPDLHIAEFMEKHIASIRTAGDSVGGMISGVIQGVSSGSG